MPDGKENELNISSEADDVMQLDTSIAQISDEEFERLMSGDDVLPVNTPEPAPKSKTPPKEEKVKAKSAETPIGTLDELEEFATPKDPKKKTVPQKEVPWPSPGKEEEEEEEDDDGEDVKEKEEELEEVDEETARSVLSSTYQHLVKTGVWKEVEGEGFDPKNINSDIYAQVATQQANEAAHEAFEELMDRSGKYRVILDHAMRNGNPDEIINIFKEDQYNNSLDMDVPTDQKEMIRKYYKNIMEWEDADIENFINKAEADKELDKYSGIAKKGYQKYIDTAVASQNAELKQKEAKAAHDQSVFESTMGQAIGALKVDDKEKHFLHRAIFEPAFKLTPQKTITAFQAQMLRLQQDPNEYLDLIRFVMDKKKYLSRTNVKKENTEVQEKFKLRLGGQHTTGGTEQIPASRRTTSKEQQDLKFFNQ